MKNIIEEKYYVLSAESKEANKKWYKIGEALRIARPEKLKEKYEKYRANDVSILTFETLPYKNEKRLNDKAIHAEIKKGNILKPAYPVDIKFYFDESDGCNEFFEPVNPMTDNEVIEYIAKVVAKLSKNTKNFTAAVKENIIIEYASEDYHKVGFDIIDKIIDFENVNDILYKSNSKNILLIGQFEFEFISTFALRHNVYIWHDANEQKHDYGFNRINHSIKYVNNLEELIDLGIDFNLIIANPPYGKIGAEITHTIVDNIEYDEYINLLPANDYHRGIEDLYKYADINSMISIKDGFTDAKVTTYLARINKMPSTITEAEFEIKNYIDRSLDKYFYENRNRAHSAIDAACYPYLNNPIINSFSNETMVTIWQREVASGRLGKRNSKSYKWNVEKSFDSQYFIDNCFANTTKQAIGAFCILDTPIEKNNLIKFMYSVDGYRFMSKLFTSMNVDSGIVPLHKFMPKVDWTREWTVEEILADYGYTESEIKEVMDDLVNFKGMDD